ncbi:hypothetical protein [Streptomyces pilosus]|uniref:hypothetical protein n=1 Tax=Streptomyces pilosus TaxID=28893 RepID=UPI00363FFB2F
MSLAPLPLYAVLREALWLLHTAAGVNPAVFDLSRLLPDTAGQPSTSRPALQPRP